MTADRCGTQDPLEREIEHVLNPGEFIPDAECFSFVFWLYVPSGLPGFSPALLN